MTLYYQHSLEEATCLAILQTIRYSTVTTTCEIPYGVLHLEMFPITATEVLLNMFTYKYFKWLKGPINNHISAQFGATALPLLPSHDSFGIKYLPPIPVGLIYSANNVKDVSMIIYLSQSAHSRDESQIPSWGPYNQDSHLGTTKFKTHFLLSSYSNHYC